MPHYSPKKLPSAGFALIVAGGTLLLPSIDVVAETSDSWPTEVAQVTGDDKAAKVVNQKIKLLNSLLRSSIVDRALASGAEKPARLLKEIKRLRVEGQTLLENGDSEGAGKSIAAAMKKVSALASMTPKRNRSSGGEKSRARFLELKTSVQSYLGTIGEAAVNKASAKLANRALRDIRRLVVESESDAASDNYSRAEKVMSEAYKIAVKTVTQLRDKKTVTYSLEFKTPADEYKYEAERNENFESLVDIVLKEHKPSEGLKKLVARYVAESRKIRDEANALASEQNYVEAIKAMERASKNLSRALGSINPKYAF